MDRVACRLHGLDGCGPRCVGSTHHLDFLANFKPALPQDFCRGKALGRYCLAACFYACGGLGLAALGPTSVFTCCHAYEGKVGRFDLRLFMLACTLWFAHPHGRPSRAR